VSEQSKEQEIRELEQRIAELRGEGEPFYTRAEIRAMSKDEVEANWPRVQRSLAALSEPSQSTAAPARTEPPEPVGVDRMARAYADAEGKGGGR
jgi:hypothetical protein